MEWLSENWVLVLLFGGMAAMLLFGHGHGGHKHGKKAKPQAAHDEKTDRPSGSDAASEDG